MSTRFNKYIDIPNVGMVRIYQNEDGYYHAVNFGIQDKNLDSLIERVKVMYHQNDHSVMSESEWSYSHSATNNSIYHE